MTRVAWANRLRAVAKAHAQRDHQVMYTLAQMGVLSPLDAARALRYDVLRAARDRGETEDRFCSVEQFRVVVEDYAANYTPRPPRQKGLWDYVLARGW